MLLRVLHMYEGRVSTNGALLAAARAPTHTQVSHTAESLDGWFRRVRGSRRTIDQGWTKIGRPGLLHAGLP